jgi:uncharacterized phage protein (TIGR01671 family)
MREYLFRGKSVDNGEWVYGYYVKGATRHCVLKSLAQPHIYDVIPETVGEYTGLTDKNGKKIFENDIIRFEDELYIVKRECDTAGGYWAETGFILKHIGWCDYTHFTDTIDDWENECQVFVIGNIHDNKELLGE